MKRKKKYLLDNEIVRIISTLVVYEFIKWYMTEFAIRLFR